MSDWYCYHKWLSTYFPITDGYTSETLELQWYKEPVEEKDDIILSHFSLGCEETIKCDKVYAGCKVPSNRHVLNSIIYFSMFKSFY